MNAALIAIFLRHDFSRIATYVAYYGISFALNVSSCIVVIVYCCNSVEERYCNLLHKEGVIPEFKEIAARSNCVDLSPSLPQLAKIIVQNYESFCSNLEQPMDTT